MSGRGRGIARCFRNEALAWIPLEAEQAPAPTQTTEVNTKLILGRVPSILLVEDNADMRAYVRCLLQEGGYAVETASDGQQALLLTAKGGYDLILSDVMMPRMDGKRGLCFFQAGPD
jgi:PleD family two-component response regulator